MKTTKQIRWREHHLAVSERPRVMFEYYVTGRGMFPIDMLRHDGAWPASGEDAAKIEWGYTEGGAGKTRSIKLRSYRAPTVDRWSSFVWSVGADNLEARVQQVIDEMKPLTT